MPRTNLVPHLAERPDDDPDSGCRCTDRAGLAGPQVTWQLRLRAWASRKGHQHANKILIRNGLPPCEEDPWCDICNLPRPTSLVPDPAPIERPCPLQRTMCLLDHG